MVRTAQELIDLSVSEGRTVAEYPATADQARALLEDLGAEADDDCDTWTPISDLGYRYHIVWGTRDGSEWRVHVVTGECMWGDVGLMSGKKDKVLVGLKRDFEALLERLRQEEAASEETQGVPPQCGCNGEDFDCICRAGAEPIPYRLTSRTERTGRFVAMLEAAEIAEACIGRLTSDDDADVIRYVAEQLRAKAGET